MHGADQARQHPGDAVLGNQTAPRESGGELRAIRHEADVAIERDHEADAGYRAVDAGDDRFLDGQQIAAALREVGGQSLRWRLICNLEGHGAGRGGGQP